MWERNILRAVAAEALLTYERDLDVLRAIAAGDEVSD